MNDENGLIYAFLLDGSGGGTGLDWDGIRAWEPGQGPLWVHLDYTAKQARRWLRKESGLDLLVSEALGSEESRPRCSSADDGLLVSLRGVNSNPGSDPEDMVAIRAFASEGRIVTTRHRRLLTPSDMAEDIRGGTGSRSTGELLVTLADRLIERMVSVVTDLDDRMDALEESMLAGGGQEIRGALLELRQEVILLRRYLAPQREALTRMHHEPAAWLSEHDRLQLRETTDMLTRHVEDLDSIKDRAGVANEELSSRMAEQMNARMYVLSLIAGLFLPLGFLTGLLGINVGGIPMAENPWGFVAIVVLVVVIAASQLLWFKRKHWL